MQLNPKKTYKSRQKLWLNYIKEKSKESKFKFSSYFIFKLEGDIIYSSSFNVSLIENKISGYLNLLPEGLSEIFWKITDLEDNISRSLSFRVTAAFNVSHLIFYRFNIEIKNLDKFETEIDKLLTEINKEIKSNQILNIYDYLNHYESQFDENEAIIGFNDCCNLIGMICGFIKIGDLEKAKYYSNFALKNELNSGYNFGGKGFYDLVVTYLNKTDKKPNIFQKALKNIIQFTK